jgi:uncharacterized protein (TIGR03067 family)
MPTDLDKLQGAWTITSLEIDSRAQPAPADGTITIQGQRFVSTGMGATYEGVVELGRVERQKTIDLVFDTGHAAGVRNLGIYTLVGDRWTLCLATRGTVRPAKLASPAESGIVLETLERDGSAPSSADGASKRRAATAPPTPSRAASPRKTAPAAAGDAQPGAAATEIEGEWQMVSAVFDGKPMEESMVQWCKRSIHGDITKILAGPQTMLHARFTIDSSQAPPRIDYVNLAGSTKGKAQAGIYELGGDGLQICMAPPGATRPKEFTSAPGDGRSYTTWTRSKT